MILTLLLILVPSALCLIVVILLNEKFPIELKLFLTVLYLISLSVCLFSLLYCSGTEPGVIPSLTMHNILPDRREYQPNKKLSYYALYQDRAELDRTMKDLGYREEDYAAKFFDKKKYKY